MALQYRYLKDYLAAVKRRFYVDPDAFGSGDQIYSEAERVDDLNTAREEIASELLCSATRGSFTTVAGTTVYDLTSMSTRLILVDNVFYATTKLERNMLRADDQWARSLTDTATPEYYYIDEAQQRIHLTPSPDAVGTVRVYYYQIPQKLTSFASSETTIPIQYRHLPELYALWRGYEKVPNGASKAVYYMKLWDTGLAKAKNHVKNGQMRGGRKKLRFRGYGLRNTTDWE